MPGSPPTSTIDPGTRPPPSTRFSSSEGICMRGSSVVSISETFCTRLAGVSPRCFSAFTDDEVTVTRSSTIVFQAPHDGHRPSHFGESAPHSEQNHTVFCFAFAIYSTG